MSLSGGQWRGLSREGRTEWDGVIDTDLTFTSLRLVVCLHLAGLDEDFGPSFCCKLALALSGGRLVGLWVACLFVPLPFLSPMPFRYGLVSRVSTPCVRGWFVDDVSMSALPMYEDGSMGGWPLESHQIPARCVFMAVDCTSGKC